VVGVRHGRAVPPGGGQDASPVSLVQRNASGKTLPKGRFFLIMFISDFSHTFISILRPGQHPFNRRL
jgi:hypothetical protein